VAWFRRLASRRAGQSGDLPRATRSSSTELAGSGAAGARGAERAQLARASKRWRRLPAAAWSSSTELGAAARQARSWRNRGSFTELARWAAICPGGMAGDFGESWWAGRPLRNMRQNGDPDDFCGLGGSLRCRSWDGARGGNRDRSPKASRAWPGWVFCRETFGSSRSGEPNRAENSAGAGLFGLRAHSRHI